MQVLYLTEPIDEPALNNISEFGDFKFVDVTREDLDLGDVAEDEKKKVCIQANLLPLCHTSKRQSCMASDCLHRHCMCWSSFCPNWRVDGLMSTCSCMCRQPTIPVAAVSFAVPLNELSHLQCYTSDEAADELALHCCQLSHGGDTLPQ